MYYTVIKDFGHLRTLEKCRKHLPAAHFRRVLNACRVLSQCNTRLRLLHFFFLVHKGELFCSREPTFIDLKIWWGLHHIGVILVLSQGDICRLEFILRVAQPDLKVSYRFLASVTDGNKFVLALNLICWENFY